MARLLRPRSIAIVGASPTPGALGASVLRNLDEARFSGALYLINPKRATIGERACLPSVDALPEGVDCAVLAIPRAGVLGALEACGRRGVGSAIIFSAGFAESGDEGRAEQDRIREIARATGMVIEGPNCLGVVNYVERIPLTFVGTPIAALPAGRGVAIVSQSGAMAAVLSVNLRARGLALTYTVSTGNEAAAGVEDFVAFMIEDAHTQVIAMIVEQFRQPKRFLDLVERARSVGKRIVLLHPGSSSAARASAATHTGAMAGNYQVMRCKVERAGVLAVETLEELGDVTDILVRCPPFTGGGAAVFTESGAFKALTLDFCERLGLPLPPLADATADTLRQVLPDFIPPTNPLDITAQGLVDPEIYRRALPPVLADEAYGSVLLSIILTDEATAGLKFPPILRALREIAPTKPVLFAGMDEGAASVAPTFVEELRALGVPFFPSPERAFRALALITAFGFHTAPPMRQVGRSDPRYGCDSGVPQQADSRLRRHPHSSGRAGDDVEQALAIASRIGFLSC